MSEIVTEGVQTVSGTVKLEIDGRPVEVREGTTILDAAAAIGIEIPVLRQSEGLSPEWVDRMSTVDVEAGPKVGLVSASTEPSADGMRIRTRSSRAVQARRFVADLLVDDHPADCPQCATGEICDLKRYAAQYGVDGRHFGTTGQPNPEAQGSANPLFTYDPLVCVTCLRCVSTCDQWHGYEGTAVSGRVFGVPTPLRPRMPWTASICESCGNCVSHCPTGALWSKGSKKYPEDDIHMVRTTCPHCGTGCQLDLLVADNRIIGVQPGDGPSNKGMLCVKGKYASFKFIYSGDRLTHPLIKRNGVFDEATWDEALDLIEAKFTQIKADHGPDAIAGFSCSRAPNEDNYLFQKMMRAAFGTNNVDNSARVCHSASVHGLAMTLGSGAMTNPISDITNNVNAILLIGSNPEEAHPVAGAQIRDAVLKGAKLIVVDPRKIDLSPRAEIELQVRPGTNTAFANGMAHVIIEEGLQDREFIETRTEGYEEFAQVVKDYTPERVAEICGIDADDLRRAARIYATAKRAPIIYCLGVTEHSSGTEGVMSLSNLAMLVGKLGKPGCGVNPLRGQNNVQGACDMGCMPDKFPGYQTASDEAVVRKFEQAWGVSLSRTIGLTSTEVIPAALEGRVRGAYIFGEDPAFTDADISRTQEGLKSLDFLVVQELFMTATAELADVVLPGVSYAEKEGTFTNTDRRVQRVRSAVKLDGDMRLDTDIFCDVMTRMGYPSHYDSAADIMDEIASVTPSYAGISFERLDAGEQLQWPCWDKDHPGTPILHRGKFTRGLGLFYPTVQRGPQELPDETYPLTLVTGRMLYHYNNGSITMRADGFDAFGTSSYVEMHHDDAQALGVNDGDRVRVASRRGAIEATARVGARVRAREVFMPLHFADGNVNVLTNAVLDDIAKIPEFKACAVSVRKA
ncbi:MAG: formate dehydrogenase subunit alpha [Propionibacteriaceae bacterium]|nr:formate dehydrogenase subunit alpha [Propionibacteriaceae bacterium]